MHLEMTNKICALCKRPVATNGHSDPARLCEECRSLIEMILPNADSSALIEVEQPYEFALPQFAAAGLAHPAIAAHAPLEEDMEAVEITSQPGRYEMASFDPVADFDELQADRLTITETEYLDEFEASSESAGMPARALPGTAGEAVGQAGEPAAQEPEVYIMSEQAGDFYGGAGAFGPAPSERLERLDASHDDWHAQSIDSPQAAETDVPADFKSEISKGSEAAKDKDAAVAADTEAAPYQAAVDPWDDPLPAWEQSRNEYPLYVGMSEHKPRLRLKRLLVPAALLACLVAAYFVFQSGGGAPKNEQTVAGPAAGGSESTPPPAAPQAHDQTRAAGGDARQATPASNDPATDAGGEKKDASAAGVSASAGAEARWRYSLQAMASQSEDEAGAFAERVRVAGIPAYVISADIANRGRWFRVRVGGFSTAQEAQRFAADARARAKAAGVALRDLNVVDYVKP
ncbi:MAG: SPOR domain-containing protein [Blastocatellia bacterium]